MIEFNKFCKSYKHPELGCMLNTNCGSCKIIYKHALGWVLDRINFHYGEELNGSDIVLDIQQEIQKVKKNIKNLKRT